MFIEHGEQFLNPVAEITKPDSGDIILPSQAKPGDKLFCPDHDCKDPERKLFLKRSALGNLFFSHRPGFSHPIFPETLLHKLAIKWFEGKMEFEIPGYVGHDQILMRKLLILDPSKTVLEFRQYQSVIPDVIVESVGNFKIALEIVVTNDVSSEKSKLLNEIKLPTICIDLTDFYNQNREACRTDVDFIKSNLDTLLHDLSRKRWVRLPGLDEQHSEIDWKKKEVATTDGCLVLLSVLLSLITAILYIVF